MINIKPSAILFDFDDTLIDAKPITQKALYATFADFNIDNSALENIDFTQSMRNYFHLIFADNLKEAGETYYKYYTEFSKKLVAFEQAEEVLKFLQKKSIYTAVVSNKGGSRLRDEINNKFFWNDYFASIVGAGDAKEDKPSALPAKQALQDSKLKDYSNVWFIGDSFIDMKTADNLGCKGILFGSKTTTPNIPTHASVMNHKELLALLQELYV
jgi:phosphoglycolate phosphatase